MNGPKKTRIADVRLLNDTAVPLRYICRLLVSLPIKQHHTFSVPTQLRAVVLSILANSMYQNPKLCVPFLQLCHHFLVALAFHVRLTTHTPKVSCMTSKIEDTHQGFRSSDVSTKGRRDRSRWTSCVSQTLHKEKYWGQPFSDSMPSEPVLFQRIWRLSTSYCLPYNRFKGRGPSKVRAWRTVSEGLRNLQGISCAYWPLCSCHAYLFHLE